MSTDLTPSSITDLVVATAEVLRGLNEEMALSEVLARLTGELGKRLTFEQTAVWSIADNQIDVNLLYQAGNPDPVVSPIALSLAHDRSPFRAVWEAGMPLLIGDVASDERFEWNQFASFYRSWAGLPLISRGKVLGFLTVASAEPNGFRPPDFHAMQRSAEAMALCVDFIRLSEDAARRDRVWDRMLEGVPSSARELRGATREDYVEEALQTLASALYAADIIALMLRSEQYLKAFREMDRLHESLRLCLSVLQKQL